MSDRERPVWVLPVVVVVAFAGFGGCGLLVVIFGAAFFLAASAPQPIAVQPVPLPPVPAPVVEPAEPSPRRTEGPFVYSETRVTLEPAPERFSAALPGDTARDWDAFIEGDPRFPPVSMVTDLACAGDPDVNRRILEAVRRAAASGSRGEDLVVTHGALYEDCASPAACEWLRGVVEGTDSAAVKAPFWQALARCPPSQVEATFKRADVPPSTQDAWVYNRVTSGVEVRRKRPLAEQVRLFDVDLDDVVAENRQARPKELEDALAECARAASSWRARACLGALASQDWKRARSVRKAMPGSGADGELSATLDRFADRESLLQRLRKDGLLKPGDPIAPAAATVRDVLDGAGRAYAFDVETGFFPNEHDSLLHSLARLARPELEGIAFLEEPPSGDGGPYVLHAWLGGRRWTVRAEDLGDWYDLETCLGLLNSILSERGSSTRLVSLETGDQTAFVVAGPKDALVALAAEGVVRLESASAGVEDGKAFEDAMIEALKKQEMGNLRFETR